jgi:hypothetical protein
MKRKYLWLDAILDEKSIGSFESHSPATSFWQHGFVRGIMSCGHSVYVIGTPSERAWPFGRLLVSSKDVSLPNHIEGRLFGYLNIPGIRGFSQFLVIRSAVNRFIKDHGLPDYSVTFSCQNSQRDISPMGRVAKYLQSKYEIPWLCIVGDGLAPLGADHYVIQNWKYFLSNESPTPKVHLDGGLAEIPSDELISGASQKLTKNFMYMGAFTKHGGASLLARAFTRLTDANVNLFFSGRGENEELARLADKDQRIKVLGFLTDTELHHHALDMYAFVNPRLTDWPPNKLNFPSKLLHYFAYAKPVISTITDGMSPDYLPILLETDGTEDDLVLALRRCIDMPVDDYNDKCKKIEKFNIDHTWDALATQLNIWLDEQKKQN